MEIVMKSIVLSLILSISSLAFFDTLLPVRRFIHSWIRHTSLLAFLAGYLVIAFTPIPPWLFQPLRLTAVVLLPALFYYQSGILKTQAASEPSRR